MAAELQTPNKQLTTGRFKLPDKILPLIQTLRLIGSDLLVYTSPENLNELTELLTGMGLSKVDRKYQLHVSSNDEDTFKKLFSQPDLEYEVCPTNTNRFIAKVSFKTQEDYDKHLELDADQSNGCRIKPYKPRFATSVRDNSSDITDQYQRRPQPQEFHLRDGAGGGGGGGFTNRGNFGKGKGGGKGKGKGKGYNRD
jgi:hypothetical protein